MEPIKFEVIANKVGNSIKITLPKEIVKCLKIKPGNIIELWEEESHIILDKKLIKNV